jgi:malate dehydrogenase
MLAQKELGDIVLVRHSATGKPDQGESAGYDGILAGARVDANIIGTSDYADIAGSDLVIITAGIARKPGMSRDDLVNTNAGIMRSVAKREKHYAPGLHRDRAVQPGRRDDLCRLQNAGFPEKPGHRPIRRAGYGPFQHVSSAMELNVSVEDVTRRRARRPRRRHGAAGALLLAQAAYRWKS